MQEDAPGQDTRHPGSPPPERGPRGKAEPHEGTALPRAGRYSRQVWHQDTGDGGHRDKNAVLYVTKTKRKTRGQALSVCCSFSSPSAPCVVFTPSAFWVFPQIHLRFADPVGSCSGVSRASVAHRDRETKHGAWLRVTATAHGGDGAGALHVLTSRGRASKWAVTGRREQSHTHPEP